MYQVFGLADFRPCTNNVHNFESYECANTYYQACVYTCFFINYQAEMQKLLLFFVYFTSIFKIIKSMFKISQYKSLNGKLTLASYEWVYLLKHLIETIGFQARDHLKTNSVLLSFSYWFADSATGARIVPEMLYILDVDALVYCFCVQ